MSPKNWPPQSLTQDFIEALNRCFLTIDPTSPLPTTGRVLSFFGSRTYDFAQDLNGTLAMYHISVSACGGFLLTPAFVLTKVTRDYTLQIDQFLIDIQRPPEVVDGFGLHTPDYPGHLFSWPIAYFEVDRLWEPPANNEYLMETNGHDT